MAKRNMQRTPLGNRHESAVLAVIEVTLLPLVQIRTDRGTQMRANLRDETITDYSEVMEAAGGWGKFPPLEVVYTGEEHILTDGFHRLAAARQAGLGEAPVTVYPGDLEFAIERSLRANSEHGLRRSNADKLRAVTTALMMQKWMGKSDPLIAELCAVTPRFVGQVRERMEKAGQIQVAKTRTGADGRTRDVSRIGRPAAAAPAVPAPAPTGPVARPFSEPQAVRPPEPSAVPTAPPIHREAVSVETAPELVSIVMPRHVAVKLHDAVIKSGLASFLSVSEQEKLAIALRKVLLEGVR